MFINNAWAEAAATPGTGEMLGGYLMPLVLVFAIFYLLVWRPQSQKMKAHEEMTKSLRRGDKVVTTGGIHGTVAKVVDDDTLELDVSEGVRMTFSRHAISALLSKGNPVKKEKPAKKSTKKAA